MSENEGYDLRKSTKKIGELYPVIMSKTGEVVDGFHRINAKADWRREVREDIDTPEKVLIARLISNKFRRQVSAEEVKGWINDLAELALKERGVQPGEISGWVAEETGYMPDTIIKYLDEKYKHPDKVRGGEHTPISAGLNPAEIISEVKEITQKTEPTIDFETPTGLLKAVKILKKEAKKKAKADKTPEQLSSEKAEKERKKLENESKKKEQETFKEEKLKEKIKQEVTKEIKMELKDEVKQEVFQQLASEEKTATNILNEKKKLEREQELERRRKEIGELQPIKANIYNRDFKTLLNKIPSCSIDLLITDPPYMTDVDNIDSFVESWVNPVLNTLKDSGQAYIFTGAYFEEIKAYTNKLSIGQGAKFTKQILVWEYRNTIGPQPKTQYKQNWQAIFYLRGPEAPEINTDILTELFSVQQFNAPDGRFGTRYHSWEKPLDLAKQLILHGSKQGDKIFDPFAGTGTFLLAAAELGRENIGSEISLEMIKIAEKRGCVIK